MATKTKKEVTKKWLGRIESLISGMAINASLLFVLAVAAPAETIFFAILFPFIVFVGMCLGTFYSITKLSRHLGVAD